MQAISVTVRVHARAARERRRSDGRSLELWVGAPPVQGAANAATVDAVAAWLAGPRRRVRIVSGQTAPTKVVEIDGPVVLPPPDLPPVG
ncbi:MAG: DUF167 domain-containing protein [Acidimicrobiales bacterium]